MKDIEIIKKEILEKYNGEFEVIDERIITTDKRYRREFLIKIKSTNTTRWVQLPHLSRYKYTSLRYDKDIIVSKINEITNGEYAFVSGETFNFSSKINILHKKCNTISAYRVSHFFNDGSRCRKCLHDSLRKDIETVKKEIALMSEDKIKLIGNYTSDREKMLLECVKCKLPFKKSMATLRRQFKDYGAVLCPHCYSKKYLGEVFIKDILVEKNYSFEEQKKFEGCKYKSSLKFDFIVYDASDNSKFVAIEYDGRQHHDPKSIYAKNFDEIQERDRIKNEYCEKNKIPLLRINTTSKNKIINETLKFLNDNKIKSSTTIPLEAEMSQQE